MTTMAEFAQERRSRLTSDISQAVLRIEARVLQLQAEHDEIFRLRDPKMWQTWFSLRKHSIDVSTKYVAVGKALGESDLELLLRRLKAILHDDGKRAKECESYRLNRVLSEIEMTMVATHSSRSVIMILEGLAEMRPENYWIVADLFHHIPHVIQEPEPRRKTIQLKLVDAIQGRTEKRHRPAVSLPKAIDLVWWWVQGKITPDIIPPHYEHLRREYTENFEVVREVFLAFG